MSDSDDELTAESSDDDDDLVDDFSLSSDAAAERKYDDSLVDDLYLSSDAAAERKYDDDLVDDFSLSSEAAAERKYDEEDIDLGRDLPYTKSFGRLTVLVKIGELDKEKVDVIVNSTSQKLDLMQGALSKILLQRAGAVLQQECNSKYPDGIRAGDVAITSGGALDCKHVFHVFLKNWRSIKTTRIFENTIRKCLQEAATAGMSSIAFPTLGTNFLVFPKDLVVQTFLACFKRFSMKYPSSSLTDIRVILSAKEKKQNRTFEMVAKAHEYTMSHFAPAPAARNTQEFCMIKYLEDISTPTSWTKFKSGKTVKAWRIKQGDKPAYELVTVDTATFKVVENIIQKAWDAKKIGHGQDKPGLYAINYTSFKVTKVQRLENLDLYEKYAQYQQTLFHKAGVKGLFEPLEKHPNARSGQVQTSFGMGSMLQKELYPEINEFYLFHGTKPENVDAIVKQGLDFRMANDKSMFGSGVHFTESSTKADQYTDSRQLSNTKERYMFLCRVSMGEIGMYNKTMKLKRAPCMESGCESDKCGHENRYDSVVGDGTWIFREFVIYERYQSYPEYVVTYQRC